MSHGGDLWPVLQEQFLQKDQILDFSVDLNPLGPPPILGSLLQEAWQQIQWYPEPTYRRFREAVAQREGIDPVSVLPGNGTADLIHLVSRWKAGSRAAVVVPTFTEYERAVIADGGEIIPWRLQESLQFHPDSLAGLDSMKGIRILFICNPNNPTGTLWTQDQILPWVEFCERNGILMVVDEAYMDLVGMELQASVVSWIRRYRQLLVLRSLTKSFSIPGLRVGYLAASPEVVQSLCEMQPPWGMNGLATFVGSQLMQEQEFLRHSRERLHQFRRSFWEGLCSVDGLQPFPSSANFFLCRVTDPDRSSRQLTDELRERGILIRACNDFTGLEKGRFIRVAVRRPDENARFIKALNELLTHAG